MPILKYIAVHKSPLQLLRYMTKASKTENALVSGICCPDDIDKAYKEMKWVFEYNCNERFHKKSLDEKTDIPKKERVRLHHYIQSFKPSEVSAAEAHENSEVLLLTVDEALHRSNLTNMSRAILTSFKDYSYVKMCKGSYVSASSNPQEFAIFGI